MLGKLIAAAALAVVSAGVAHAQVTGAVPNTGGFDDQQFYWNVMPTYERRETPEDRELERRYRDTLRTRIPDKKPSNDPWKSIRQAPAYDRHRPE